MRPGAMPRASLSPPSWNNTPSVECRAKGAGQDSTPSMIGHSRPARSTTRLMMDLTRVTATGLLAQLNAGEIHSEELVRAYLDRAERLGRLNVFVHLEPEAVLAQARRVDAR